MHVVFVFGSFDGKTRRRRTFASSHQVMMPDDDNVKGLLRLRLEFAIDSRSLRGGASRTRRRRLELLTLLCSRHLRFSIIRRASLSCKAAPRVIILNFLLRAGCALIRDYRYPSAGFLGKPRLLPFRFSTTTRDPTAPSTLFFE